MRKIVERLRERPEEDRKTVAAGVALATVGVLFVGWGFAFVQGLGGNSSANYAAPSAAIGEPAPEQARPIRVSPVSAYEQITSTSSVN